MRAKPVAVFVDGCFWHGCPKHMISFRLANGPTSLAKNPGCLLAKEDEAQLRTRPGGQPPAPCQGLESNSCMGARSETEG